MAMNIAIFWLNQTNLFAILMNMFLCYDLIALLRDPFSSAYVRSAYYILISGAMSMTGAALITFRYDGQNEGFYPW